MAIDSITFKGVISGAGAPNYLSAPYNVFVSGNYAYVASVGDSALVIIDITDKTSPVLEGVISGAGAPNYLDSPTDVVVSGNYAYVTAGSDNALTIIDISDKTSPAFVSKISGAGAPNYLSSAVGVVVSGNYAYVAALGDAAIVIVDITTKTSPVLKGVIRGAGSPNYLNSVTDVAVSGNYAYAVSQGDHSLTIIDITNKASPILVKVLRGAGAPNYLNTPYNIEVSGNYAYISAFAEQTLTIIDISDKTNPFFVSKVDGIAAYDVVVSEEYAYMVDAVASSLEMIDISDIDNPSVVDTISGAGAPNYLSTPNGIFVSGDYAYVAALGDDALSIFQVLYTLTPPTITANQVGTNIIIKWDKHDDIPDTPPIPCNPDYTLYWISDYEEDSPDADTIINNGHSISLDYVNCYVFNPFENAGRDVIGETIYFVVTVSSEAVRSEESEASNVVNVTMSEENLVGEKPMQELHSIYTYRLNIAADVNQRAEEAKFWSDEELLRAINEGYLDFVRRTECLQRFDTISLVADQIEYDLPSDCIKLLWVGDGVKNLHGQSLDYMDMLDDGWMERSGEPAYFVQELGGLKKINLYETPDTAGSASFTADSNHTEANADTGVIFVLEDASTEITATADSNHSEANADTGMIVPFTGESVLFPVQSETGAYFKLDQQTANLMILYAYEPEEFNNLTEAKTPKFLAAYHIAIVNFAVSELYLKEGETQNIPLSNFYRMLYEEAVENKLATSHVSNLKVTWAGGDRMVSLPSDPHLPYDEYPAYRR